MKRLILISAILISACTKPYIQPELPLPHEKALPALSEEQEARLKAWDWDIFEILAKREVLRKKRIETLEKIIQSTH